MARVRNALKKPFDLLVVGAGPVGCVAARQAADAGLNVLIVERRKHIAGNTHDRRHKSGIRVQSYGPHYFRTNNAQVIRYLSRFTEWVPGEYFVKSYVGGQYFPFPINLNTLEQFFQKKLNQKTGKRLMDLLRLPAGKPKNSEDFVLSRVGRSLYEAFYKGYSLKQWGMSPLRLDPSVCGRIPIRLNRNERYVDAKYQLMPRAGFTRLFESMIKHPRIQVLLNTDYRKIQSGIPKNAATVYCGPLDEYFGYKYGPLPYRSMRFNLKELKQDFYQPCVQVNYPNERPYVRSVEYKHLRDEKVKGRTVVSFEYPKAQGEPYYPVPGPDSRNLFRRYWKLALEEEKKGVFFCGRLAQYRYINTDEAIEGALKISKKILDWKRQTRTP